MQFITIKTYIDKIKTQLNAHKLAKSKKYQQERNVPVVVLLKITNKNREHKLEKTSFFAFTNFHFTNNNSHGLAKNKVHWKTCNN